MHIHESFFNCDHKCVSMDQNALLTDLPGPTEIKEAVFALGNVSSPGVDSFSDVSTLHVGILWEAWLWQLYRIFFF